MVPTFYNDLANTYYLHKIESSYGSVTNSTDIYFRLNKVNSAGQTNNGGAPQTWTHPAGQQMYGFTVSGTSIDDLGGQYIYIDITDGTFDAFGYTVTLTWKKVV